MSLLEKLRQEMIEAQIRFKIAKIFPDLEEVKDRWGILRLTTKTVYEKAKDFEVRHECDCCDGVNVYALPYINFEGVRLYGNTPALLFAKCYKKHNIYLEQDDWEETFSVFTDSLISKMTDWLDAHEGDPYDLEEP